MRLMKCPVCGKYFILNAGSIFNVLVDGKVKHLCGWNCKRALEKDPELKKRLKEECKYENR